MTASAPTAAPARRRPSRKHLWWAVPALLVVVVGAVFALRSPRSETPLNPHNPAPEGARAMAQVLGQQGVTVGTPESAEDLAAESIGPGTTVVVTRARLLNDDRWESFRRTTASAERIVLVRPSSAALRALDLDADIRSGSLPFDTPAECEVPDARGLELRAGGDRYAPQGDATGLTTCFSPGGGFDTGGDGSGMMLVAEASDDRPEVVVVGSEDVVRNDRVLEGDNAALGLRLLGQDDRLVWWNVSGSDIDRGNAPPPRWPDWLVPVWWVAGLTVVLLMLARGRRLGKLVTEPLPVIVRADETTRARGQLYRRAGDLDRASAVLRSGTRRRLASYLRVGRDAPTLVSAVAVASHRPAEEIAHLLLGPPPSTEAELSSLAQHLSDLEKEIRPR